MDEPSARTAERAALWLIALVGLVVRLRQLTAGRAFWLDETFVALDLEQLSLFESLVDGSPRNQLAPAGFWAAGHVAATVSSAEWFLRLFPFVGGVVLVVLGVVYANAHLHTVAARVLLVVTVSWSPALIHYSAELKQYGFEALASMAAVLVVASRERIGVWPRVMIGLLMLSLSLPALILVPLLGLLWLADEVRRHGTGAAVRRLALPGGILLVAQLGLLAYALRVEPSNMQGFWRDAFAPIPTSGDDLVWWGEAAVGFADLSLLSIGIAGHEVRDDVFSLAPLAVGVALWLLVAAGAVVSARERTGDRTPAVVAWWNVMPAVVLIGTAFVVAAIVELYPLRGRLLVHAIPLFFVAAAHGLDVSIARVRTDATRLLRPVAAAAAGVLVLAASWAAVVVLATPSRQYDSRAALEWIAERHQGGESIIYTRESVHPYDFYGPRVGLGILPEPYADPLIGGDALVAQAGGTPSWYFNAFIRDDHRPFIEEMAQHPGVVDAVWFDGTLALYIDPAAVDAP